MAVGEGRNAEAAELLEAHLDVQRVEKREDGEILRVTLNKGRTDGSFLAELLLQNGFKLRMLREEEIDLEDVFMGITKGITN